MTYEEILKAVFPLLDGIDLASCMAVCRQWRDIARDDYFWKCLCAKKLPSICKKPKPPTITYYKLYCAFNNRRQRQPLPPRLSFNDVEFFIDIWAEDKLIFSDVVPGAILQTGTMNPPHGLYDLFRTTPEYKMTLSVNPRFQVSLAETVTISMFAWRKDSNKVACIIKKSVFDYVDRTTNRAMAYDYLEFSQEHPFLPNIRAWVALLFGEEGNDGIIDVHSIQMDFCDAANSRDEVLWLLDILDWK